MDNALKVLSQIEDESKRPAEEEKVLNYDLRLLHASESDCVDTASLNESPDSYLLQLATDNCQLLVNRLFQLPSERKEDVIVHQLPDLTIRLPREKPVPKPKPLTKWQQYAKSKGFSVLKKSKKEWDKELKRWVPRFGAKKARAEREKNWVREVPSSADPNTDMFAKAAVAKRERVAKNQLNRLRNIKRQIGVPTVGITPRDPVKRGPIQLTDAAALARRSTASLGKFSSKLAGDAPLKPRGKRRHFQSSTGDARAEIAEQMQVLAKVGRRDPGAVVDSDKAANRLLYQQQRERHAEKMDTKPKSKKRWIPNSTKGEKQRKAIGRKAAGSGNKFNKGKKR